MYCLLKVFLFFQVGDNNDHSKQTMHAPLDIPKTNLLVETLTQLVPHQFAYVVTTGPYIDKEKEATSANTALGELLGFCIRILCGHMSTSGS